VANVKALVWPGMQDVRLRQPGSGETPKPIPGDEAALAAP
jgi:hypothetical protein